MKKTGESNDLKSRVLLQAKFPFNKPLRPTERIANADGFCFLFKKENDDPVDSEEEAGQLAIYLRLIFHVRTLQALKKYL